MADPLFVNPNAPPAAPAAAFITPKAESSASPPERAPEDLAREEELRRAAELEEKKKALRAELKKLEDGAEKAEKTLEERVFKLEQTVASLAGHAQPTPVVKQDDSAVV
jgi:hypothetical protein